MTDLFTYDPNAPRESIAVQFAGGEYKIRYDHTRGRLQPKYFVIDLRNAMESVRHYSEAQGAFTALMTGSIKWQ